METDFTLKDKKFNMNKKNTSLCLIECRDLNVCYNNLILLFDLEKHISEYLIENPNDEFIQALYKYNQDFSGKIYTDWQYQPLRIYDSFQNEIFVYNFFKGQYREYIVSKMSKNMRKTDDKWACKVIIENLFKFGSEKMYEIQKNIVIN